MKSMNGLYYDKYLKYKKKYLDLKKIKNKLDLKGGNPDKDKLVYGAEILVVDSILVLIPLIFQFATIT